MRFPVSPVSVSARAPAPTVPERAGRPRTKRAGPAEGIEGTVQVGIGSEGPRGKASVALTERIFIPRAEEEFMRDFMAERALEGKPAPAMIGVSAGSAI